MALKIPELHTDECISQVHFCDLICQLLHFVTNLPLVVQAVSDNSLPSARREGIGEQGTSTFLCCKCYIWQFPVTFLIP